MSFLVFLGSVPAFMVLFGAWTSSPFIFNAWLSLLTGIIVWLLLRSGGEGASITLLIIEESLSLLIIATWFLWSGGITLLLLLLINSAIAPFHTWFIRVLTFCSNESFGWGITVHNAPIIILFGSLNFSLGPPLLILSTSVGIFFLLGLSEIRNIVVLSSNNVFSSAALLFCTWSTEGMLFFLGYWLVIWSSLIFEASFTSLLFLVGLIGIPPLLLFQIKWMLLLSIFSLNTSLALILVIFSGISVVIYIRICFLMDLEGGTGGIFFFSWSLVSLLLPSL